MQDRFEKLVITSVGSFFTKEKIMKITQKYSILGLEPEENYLIKRFYSKKNSKVLVVGSGVGRDSISLAEKGFIVTGVDLTQKLLQKSIKNLENQNLKADFAVANAFELPFKKNSFDYAIMLEVFEYIPKKKNRINTLNEINRVLKKNGLLIFDSINHSFSSEIIHLIYALLIPFTEKKRFEIEVKEKKIGPLRHYFSRYFRPIIKKQIFMIFKRYLWTKPNPLNQDPDYFNKHLYFQHYPTKEVKKIINFSEMQIEGIFSRFELIKSKLFNPKFFKNFDIIYYYVLKKKNLVDK